MKKTIISAIVIVLVLITVISCTTSKPTGKFSDLPRKERKAYTKDVCKARGMLNAPREAQKKLATKVYDSIAKANRKDLAWYKLEYKKLLPFKASDSLKTVEIGLLQDTIRGLREDLLKFKTPPIKSASTGGGAKKKTKTKTK